MKPVFSKKKAAPTLDPVKTGAMVRRHRKACGVSTKQVAAKMRISESYVYMLETGQRNWSQKLFDKMIEAIEVTNT